MIPLVLAALFALGGVLFARAMRPTPKRRRPMVRLEGPRTSRGLR